MKYQEYIILRGDWNGHNGVDRTTYEINIGAYSMGNRNEAGQRLLDFVKINNSRIMNTFYKHRESHKYTWYRYDNRLQQYIQKSMIDMFITNNNKLFIDVKTIPSVSLDADHRLILAKVTIKKPKKNRNQGMKKYKLHKLHTQATKEKLVEVLQDKLQDETVEKDRVETLWKSFKDKIREAVDQVLGEKVPYRGKKKVTPWWKKEVMQMVKHRMNTFRKWMRSRSVEDRLEYTIASNEAQRIKRKAKEESWKRSGEELEKDLQGTRKLVHCLAKKYRDNRGEISHAIKNKNGTLLTDNEEIADR